MEREIPTDPIERFRSWLAEATEAGLPEPGAMALATADGRGRPSSRMVILKEVGSDGFTFATAYGSRKAQELESNPWASLVLYWQSLHRQVRIDGSVERANRATSDRIFAARPRGARISAWASVQSRPVAARAVLEERWREMELRFPDEVPRPEHWGAFTLTPERIEFWQGCPDRLHRRRLYSRDAGHWRSELLSP